MGITKEGVQAAVKGPFGKEAIVYEETGSTNDAAKLLAKQGAPHGTAVFARRQTAGKGRLGRAFFSPPDAGVYMTVILRPQKAVSEILLLTAAAAVAVSGGISDVCGLDTHIKWVNDVYCKGRKICGILAEAALGRQGIPDYLVVGIGINVKEGSFPPELSGIATSLSEQGVERVDMDRLAAAVLDRFAASYTQLEHPDFLEAYRSRSCVLGKRVRVIQGNTEFEARAVSIDGRAGLHVVDDEGVCHVLSTGEISLKGDWS